MLVLHLLRTAGDATCSVACHSATLRQPAPLPVLRLLWLRTHCRTSRCARPQPTPSPRYCLLTALLGTANFTCGYCSRRPLITAGHPVRSSAPSPSCNPGSGTPPPHRPAHCNYILLPGSSCLPGPAVSLATRETITTPPPNVYSSQHRFSGSGEEVIDLERQEGTRWSRRPDPGRPRGPSGDRTAHARGVAVSLTRTAPAVLTSAAP